MEPSSSKRKRDSDSFDEATSCKRPKNDVFLNYSYEDTGNGFVSHLKGGLRRNAFTISDHTMLRIGQDESSELVKAIDDSEIYLVVFSSKYASSVRCLDELVNIMDCLRKFKKRKVFPIFFNVDPSHLRSQQEGSFMEAFQEHENKISRERVQKWRQALKDAGQLSGLPVTNGDEGNFVSQIVKLLSKMKNPLELFDATHPVGIEPRVEDIISKLRLGDNVFIIVAVLGIGGSGKTTIVKAVYDRIAADFDARCFIENIHDYKNSGRNWKVVLQKEVISQLTGKDKFHNNGPAMIRRFITTQKVLLVLDDVDEFEQPQALGIHFAGTFGCGSRIIVTTRNKQSLSNLPYTAYEISLLNDRESFELFTKFAFGKDDPIDKKFVDEILFRAKGLPLVLEVWGRHFVQFKKELWPNILETLKRIPHGDVQKKLQISYDSLPYRSKKLFLDIACFFDGWEKDLVVKVLQDEDSGFFPDIEIQHLVDKSLVKIYIGRVSMHDAIWEMAKEVIRQEVVRREIEDKPGQHTRLIDEKGVLDVLRDCSGTESVQGFRLYCYRTEESVSVQVEAFKKMTNLRFIRLLDYEWSFSSSSGNDVMPASFSLKKLKYLEWEGFPFKCLDNIDMGNVVVIKLQHSNLEILWEGFKSLKKLRILDVSYSSSLTKTVNFAGLENLEKLCLRECENLEELHSSIGCLGKLEELDVGYCTRLIGFPWEMIGKLTSLVRLEFDDCPNISNTLCEVGSLPDNLCQLHELKQIQLSGCTNLKSIPNLPPNIETVLARGCISLVNLPSNMSELQSLTELDLDGCFKLEPQGFMKFTGLRNLHRLSMRNCNVSQVSNEIGNLVSLEYLNLSENSFSNLPDSFSNLSKLVYLKMNNCYQLQLLPLLPSNLTVIEASECPSLDVMRYDLVKAAYIFRSNMLEESFFTKPLLISLSGDEVPEWCNYRGNEDALSFVAPMHHLDKKIRGVILCGTLTKEFNVNPYRYYYPTMLNKKKETSYSFHSGTVCKRCSMFVMFCPLNDTTLVVEAGDTVLLQFQNPASDPQDFSFGLRLIYEGEGMDSTLVIQNLIEPTTLQTHHCPIEDDDCCC